MLHCFRINFRSLKKAPADLGLIQNFALITGEGKSLTWKNVLLTVRRELQSWISNLVTFKWNPLSSTAYSGHKLESEINCKKAQYGLSPILLFLFHQQDCFSSVLIGLPSPSNQFIFASIRFFLQLKHFLQFNFSFFGAAGTREFFFNCNQSFWFT